MTLFEFQADATARIGRALAFYLQATPPDKLAWTPDLPGAAGLRTMLDMIGECVVVNDLMARCLRGETVVQKPTRDLPPPVFATRDEAQAAIIRSADELARAICALPPGAEAGETLIWRGPIATLAAIEIPYRNMAYHGGQINLLQLLYGDAQTRMPPFNASPAPAETIG